MSWRHRSAAEAMREIAERAANEEKLYRRWVAYLADSRLEPDEIHRRAVAFSRNGERPPKD